LAATREEIIDPERRICDPHHHLWDLPGGRYLLEELQADTGAGHRVEQTVFLECGSGYHDTGPEAMRPVGESAFVASQAEASEQGGGARIAGIVSFADLCLGAEVGPVLDAHEKAAGGRFRGIRHASAWDASDAIRKTHTNPTPDLLSRPDFREGFRVLTERGHSFDAWLYHPQIPQLTDLARAFPEANIVLDHLGGPLGIGPYAGRRDEIREAWRPAIREIARCENVTVKLGGIGMSIYGMGWHKRERPPGSEELAEAWRPEIEWCIEHFGPSRCMFESNFPVDKSGCSYTVLWNAFKRLTAGCSEDEKALMFHDSAARVYRL
jgi:predicted TIM-barrel fold metal-dependent hydrolase